MANKLNAEHIQTASSTWLEVKRWCEQEIKEGLEECAKPGLPIIETEHARARVAVLRELLEGVKPQPVISAGHTY